MKHSVLKKIVLIGSSTGGPGQISKIIKKLPKLHSTAVVIGQHMIDGFLESFAHSLQHNGKNHVFIVKGKQRLEPGNIYVCEGETRVCKKDNELFFFHENAVKYGYNPNINTLFNSFVDVAHEFDMMVVILTGIGDDGVDACVHLNKSGVRCLTESAKSAIVDGMPGRARFLVPNIEIGDMEKIVDIISEFCE